MGSINSVTERHAYRLRNRNRRQVVAELTPDSSTDKSFSLPASDVGLSSIESVAIETPVVGTEKLVTWDQDNNNFDVINVSDGTDNSSDISGSTIVAVVTGPEE
jgi:hypothetical protein